MLPLIMKKRQLFLILIASVALFIVNNILLGSLVPRLPGGSAAGITTMFAVTLISLAVKRVWCIPLVYFFYGSIGIPSHLLTGDWEYLLIILSLVMVAAAYNWTIHRFDYYTAAYLVIFPVFVIILQYVQYAFLYIIKAEKPVFDFNLYPFFLSLLLGYFGIILGFLCFNKWNK